ncbi:ornithine cyclodeaminase family protein [Psychromarinibacter sp. C21-152]|uniref:Ornithine cyclodeaminase family protein n=1 Tax=Psychromarinibacter sediminicola TaxID=3033385 RepID=A0AAE3NR71_9RHOB|nr:ornithine cyclodeaminase family protein [Psychromarinibacter sediminicola]MDF0602778.1 ornithine cyclodeaminase family protein [Psychromarinibacter sediminicola]
MSEFLYLPDATLEELGIGTGEVADAIEAAIRDKAEGRLFDSPKAAILPGDSRYMMSTLAVGNTEELTVLKTVTVSPDNPARDLPAINGAILVLDARTGLLRALVGANWVTAVRTAALSVVAARRLADPQSKSVAFVGCGTQAHSHLAAFAEMFPLDKVFAIGRGRANVDRLCETARGMGLAAEAPEDPEAALREADLVVTSVTLDYSIEPFLDARWLKPGAFAAITDLGIPWFDAGFAALDSVVIDDRTQEAAMEKKLIAPERVDADLTELVAGAPLAFDAEKTGAFLFRGIAVGDYAAAALAVQRAEARGAGQRIPL